MNIFALDKSPSIAARLHCDKHVVKMIIEYAQLLSTAHRIIDGVETIQENENGRKMKRYYLHDARDVILYKASHVNHPSAIWARGNLSNYNWLYHLFVFLCDEYTHRYGKVHATDTKLRGILSIAPMGINRVGEMEDIPQAMPDHCKKADYVEAYRNYYNLEKSSFAKWTNRETPEWFTNAVL